MNIRYDEFWRIPVEVRNFLVERKQAEEKKKRELTERARKRAPAPPKPPRKGR